ncbi:hypothetical protein [Patulibacter americanus]|uniref:hypothetical protein n=1 Tax=Patulibacter americanus TaxID=588672 RepID=UPI0003B4E17F|nr:hypothetical protein [Patulibacter americanus]
MDHSRHTPGTGGWVPAAWVTAAVAAIVVGILAVEVAKVDRRDRELCRTGVAVREWQRARTMPPGSEGRDQLVRPVALALVGCDRPLIGLTRRQVGERLGKPEGPPVDGDVFTHWYVGGGDQRDSSTDYLVVRFAAGRVVSAEVTG